MERANDLRSTGLGDQRFRNLAFAMRFHADDVTLGFDDEVMESFEESEEEHV